MQQIILTNVGREKVNRSIKIPDVDLSEEALAELALAEVKKHVRSAEVWLDPNEEKGAGFWKVYVGIGYHVGDVEIRKDSKKEKPKKAQGRGQLTERVAAKSEKLLGYRISTRELRLMAYLQYVMANDQVLDDHKINDEEREIVAKWVERGFVKIEGKTIISKKFWNAVCEIVWLGYVDRD